MDHCCSNTGLQTYGTLKECTDINEKNQMILLYIFLSILGSGAMIFIIFCCCRCAANKDESFANNIALRCRKTARVGPMEAVSRNITHFIRVVLRSGLKGIIIVLIVESNAKL